MTLHKPIPDMSERELGTTLGIIQAELSEINSKRRQKADALNMVQAELTRRKEEKNFHPAISDHAVLRYMERVMGLDIDSLRSKILSPAIIGAMKSGATQFTADNISYRLRDNTIITIIDKGAA